VREEHWRDVDVILNQISLRDAQLRPEEFAEISKLDDSIPEFDVERVFISRQFDVGNRSFATLRESC
jgi:hypothetical protein